MRMLRFLTLCLALTLALMGCQPDASDTPADGELQQRAEELAASNIIVDGHVDLPYRLKNFSEDVSVETVGGDFDYPRAKVGGLDAPFMSIYLPVGLQDSAGASKALADSLIDLVEGIAEQHPDKFAVATSPAEVREQFEQGLISLPMGMENGSGIEDDLSNLQYFYDRGIRYITLTHAKDNLIGDSSYDTTDNRWNGLSPFGEDVVREMNRLGIMVDVSHITDSTFYDVMEITEAPAIASHSSARHFTPGFERNMSDALIQRLAENGGVIMINFGSSFLKNEYQDPQGPVRDSVAQMMEARGLERGTREAAQFYNEQRKAHPFGSVSDVVDHIDHVVDLVGVDHVGLGSDYDGVFALPEGLQDASTYPTLIAELLRRGYSEEDISKILGGNALRVWEEAERVAQSMNGAGENA